MAGYAQSGNTQQTLYMSVDVECVAVGYDHNARAIAQISLVDQWEQALLNLYVKPELPVVSYLTPLTGLTEEVLNTNGVPLQAALQTLRQYLPQTAVLVGQNIGKDVQWLGLQEGRDFQALIDLAGLYRCWNSKFNSWSVFGQDHVAKTLLGWDDAGMSHDALRDAQKSMRLFNLYNHYQQNPDNWKQAQDLLLHNAPAPSFAKRNPTYEGVCMGNRKSCICGAPFLG